MGVAYINPMTGQQIKLIKGSSKPNGCWTAIGEVPDEDCEGYAKIDTIMQTNTIISSVDDTDMAVGDDFIPEDDEF